MFYQVYFLNCCGNLLRYLLLRWFTHVLGTSRMLKRRSMWRKDPLSVFRMPNYFRLKLWSKTWSLLPKIHRLLDDRQRQTVLAVSSLKFWIWVGVDLSAGSMICYCLFVYLSTLYNSSLPCTGDIKYSFYYGSDVMLQTMTWADWILRFGT